MSGTWYVIIALAIAASWSFYTFVLQPWFARKLNVKEEAPSEHGKISVKETCEIHSKLGDLIEYDCGHHDAPEFRIDFYGEPLIHKKPDKGKLFCSDCLLAELLKVTRRCGACGFIIKPGDPVALCVDDKRIGKKEWKTLYDDNLLVCLRWECGNSPGYCGHWMGDGIKPAFADGGNHISQVFKTGQPLYTEIGPIDPSEPPSK